MVSLRRRKLLGLCSGKNSFLATPSKFSDNGSAPENPSHRSRTSVHPISSDDVNQPDKSTIVNAGPGSSSASDLSSSKEQSGQPISGPPIKRRKRHRRKHFQNQEACLMRGVYFKNMKWQAAIKVDKKQIHLGTVSSQEEAARLYDRAAFMCGREPNFELLEVEKRELSKFKWEEFLAMTRRAITNKKFKSRLDYSSLQKRAETSLQNVDDSDGRQGVIGLSAPEDVHGDTSAS